MNVSKAELIVRHIPVENLVFWMSAEQETADDRTSNVILKKTLPFKGDADTLATHRVAVVNETFARYFFGDKAPIGRHFVENRHKTTKNPDTEIVGLVKDAKYSDLREEFQPIVFVPEGQDEERNHCSE